MKSKITPAALKAHQSGDLENFIIATTPGGIEAQEKRGQIEQSFAETLPIDGTSTEEQRKQFEALGFVFALDRTAAQNRGREAIFVDVKFPTGWRKQATDHSMWSNLLDEQGRKRGGIFYKAAFYDRSAAVHLVPRYSTGTEPEGGWETETKSGRHVGVVKDGEGSIFSTAPTEPEPPYHGNSNEEHLRQSWLDWMKTKDGKGDEAKAWLSAKYPDYKSPLAYWDDGKAQQ